ncbi:MAG: VacB/RNase II family 3'-5' exoribonuclease [Firmicutes bacterium]|nr:VacB/RNase II family 3'-5' exoribonuclease [Bacillota bacterium]
MKKLEKLEKDLLLLFQEEGLVTDIYHLLNLCTNEQFQPKNKEIDKELITEYKDNIITIQFILESLVSKGKLLKREKKEKLKKHSKINTQYYAPNSYSFPPLSGDVVKENGVLKIHCDQYHYLKTIIHSLDGKEDVGDKVIFEVIDKENVKNIENHKDKLEDTYIVKVTKIVAKKKDNNRDMKALLELKNVAKSFPKSVKKEARALSSIIPKEEYERRQDRRDHIIYTIDGADTKDMDDAISARKDHRLNTYHLTVDIADVTYFVKPGSEIDKEALRRGVSYYLGEYTIPMVPPKLTNHICSLCPREDRLSLTVEAEIDKNGIILNSSIYESVIHSKKKMVYEEVNEILEIGTIPKNYEDYVPHLMDAYELAQILHKRRMGRGFVSFDVPEPRLFFDASGKVIKIENRRRGTSEKMVEEFMLLANEIVAQKLYQTGYPSIYRIHDTLNIKKLNQAYKILLELGIDIGRYMDKMNQQGFTPKALEELLDATRKLENGDIVHRVILECLTRARYSANPLPHFGVGLDKYLHFTSPIRRYSDIVAHRLVKEYLFEGKQPISIQAKKDELTDIAYQISMESTKADRLEEKAIQTKIAEYMENYIGEEYDGRIIQLSSHSIHVELDNYVEVIIPLNRNEFTFYKDISVSNISGVEYHLGDIIRVKIDRVNKLKGNVYGSYTGETKRLYHQPKK